MRRGEPKLSFHIKSTRQKLRGKKSMTAAGRAAIKRSPEKNIGGQQKSQLCGAGNSTIVEGLLGKGKEGTVKENSGKVSGKRT